MVGQTSQTVEVERQREAEMFKLFELLTGGAANEANAYTNEKRQRQQTYFYRDYRNELTRDCTPLL